MEKQTDRHPRRKTRARTIRRIVLVVVGLPVAFVLLNLALMWDPSPIGHWRSDDAKARFDRAYDETMAILPKPALTADVPTDFGTVRAYRFEKPDADDAYRKMTPLVLLPGYSSPAPLWLDNIPRLAAGRPVIAIDLLGQPGRSTQTRKFETNADQARWLDQTLSGLGVERAHLLGVSFGGWTAMNLARHHPERVASANLLDPAFVFAPPTVSMMVAAMLTNFPLMPDSFTEWFGSWTAGGAPADDSVPEARLVSAGIDGYAVVGPSPDVFGDGDLKRVRTPVMAVMAGRSVVHDSRAAVDHGRATVAGIDISLEPDATHAIHGEMGEEMDRRVLDFCAAHEG